MGYIEQGKKEGATLHLGGDSDGGKGYFINVSTSLPHTPIILQSLTPP